jgi:hypothetical protein
MTEIDVKAYLSDDPHKSGNIKGRKNEKSTFSL